MWSSQRIPTNLGHTPVIKFAYPCETGCYISKTLRFPHDIMNLEACIVEQSVVRIHPHSHLPLNKEIILLCKNNLAYITRFPNKISCGTNMHSDTQNPCWTHGTIAANH